MGWIGKLFSTLFVSLSLFQSGTFGKQVPDSYIIKYNQTPINVFNPHINVDDYYPHIDAYSIKADGNSISSLLRSGNIEYIEPNQIFSATHETQQNVPSWG